VDEEEERRAEKVIAITSRTNFHRRRKKRERKRERGKESARVKYLALSKAKVTK
jgi:hypothetical protein